MFRSVLVALLAVLALGAVAASAAQAEAEGPFWRVPCHKVSEANKGNGAFNEEGCKKAGGLKEWDTRLLSGETTSMSEKAATSFVFKFLGFTVTCTKLKLAYAIAVGSSGANPGTREGDPTFEGCTQKGNNEEPECKVAYGKTITFHRVVYRLGYEKYGSELKERRGKILILLTPSTGTVFVEFAFEGTCKISGSLAFEGSVAVEAKSGGKAVEVGKEPAQTKVSEANFPTIAIKTIWVESGGTVEERKPKLTVIGQPLTLQGRSESELVSTEPFGVFTQ
jgi:hypothetical protein